MNPTHAEPPRHLEPALIDALAQRRWQILGVTLPERISLVGPLSVAAFGLNVLSSAGFLADRPRMRWRYFIDAGPQRYALDMKAADERGETFAFAGAQADHASRATLDFADRLASLVRAPLIFSLIEFPSLNLAFLLMENDAQTVRRFVQWRAPDSRNAFFSAWVSQDEWLAEVRAVAAARHQSPGDVAGSWRQ